MSSTRSETAYRAVVFDFFGTLTCAVTRGPRHAHVARLLGCDPGTLVDLLDRSFLARCEGRYGSPAATLRWMCDQLGTDPTDAELRAAGAARVAAVRADTRLRPESVPTLRELRRCGLRTAVVSDCGYELPAFLPCLPVAALLDTVVYSVDIGTRKPDPAMYAAACARLGVRPRECVYVGDGGSRELTGARAVGMTAVRLAAPDLSGHLAFDSEPDWDGPVIETLSEIVPLVSPDRAAAAGRGPARRVALG